jgi:hypothetical protein
MNLSVICVLCPPRRDYDEKLSGDFGKLTLHNVGKTQYKTIIDFSGKRALKIFYET